MDIILIHPNDMKAVYGDTLKYVACEPPYWCGIAAQYYLDRGFKVRIIDAEAENMSPEDVAEEVKKQNPALIGVFATGTDLSASTQKMQGVDLTCQAIKTVFPGQDFYGDSIHLHCQNELCKKVKRIML